MHREWDRQHFTHSKQNTCLPIFDCLQAESAMRQRRLLLQYVTRQLMLPAHRWKRSLQLCCPQVALRKRPFSDGNQAPDCRRIVYCLHKWRAGNAAILRVDRHLQRIVVSVHLSLDACDVFPYPWEYSPSPAGDRPIMVSS